MRTDIKIIKEIQARALWAVIPVSLGSKTRVLPVSVAWLLLLPSALVCGWLYMRAWARLQFALTSSKTKLLSRIPTAGILETEAQTELFSLIQHVFPHRTDGYISGVLMCSAGRLKLLNLAVRRGLYCRFTSVQEGHKLQEVTDACCIWAPILSASAPTRASVVIATHTWAAWQMSFRLKEMAFYRFTGEQWRPGGKWIQNMVHYSLPYKNEPKLSFLS